jgi:hypothetical protein
LILLTIITILAKHAQKKLNMAEKKIMSDKELKEFLKTITDVLKIDHTFEPTALRACVTCFYIVQVCWLCDQCISCCKWNVDQLV